MDNSNKSTCSSAAFYRLSKATRIGRGQRRECHIHPGDEMRCIKIMREPDDKPGTRDQNAVEWQTFVRLQKRGVPLTHLAICHGWAETNRGLGLVCERVANEDGSFATTLDRALTQGIGRQTVDRALAELKQWTLQHAVVVSDIRPSNLMVRHGRDGEVRLVFIDGLGGRRIDRRFWFRQTFPRLARGKTRRQWREQWGRKFPFA